MCYDLHVYSNMLQKSKNTDQVEFKLFLESLMFCMSQQTQRKALIHIDNDSVQGRRII